MKVPEFVSSLGAVPLTRVLPPLDSSANDRATIQRDIYERLPPSHQELLRLSNGVEAYDGFYRLFGVGRKATIDMVWWNDEVTWKFAWGDRLHHYWSFGESPWGGQFVYRMSDLKGEDTTEVYSLDAFSMQEKASFRWASFEEFLEREFSRFAREPWDTMARRAHERFGRRSPDKLLNYVPSLLISGEESLENVMAMNAAAAMIANGDMYRQLAEQPTNRSVAKIDVIKDEAGRDRLQVVWAD